MSKAEEEESDRGRQNTKEKKSKAIRGGDIFVGSAGCDKTADNRPGSRTTARTDNDLATTAAKTTNS